MPDRMETSVDLPAPLRPTRPRHLPASIDRLTPRSARVVPKRFSMPVTSTSAWPLGVIFRSIPDRVAGAPCGAPATGMLGRGGRGADAAVGLAVHVAPQL